MSIPWSATARLTNKPLLHHFQPQRTIDATRLVVHVGSYFFLDDVYRWAPCPRMSVTKNASRRKKGKKKRRRRREKRKKEKKNIIHSVIAKYCQSSESYSDHDHRLDKIAQTSHQKSSIKHFLLFFYQTWLTSNSFCIRGSGPSGTIQF